MKHYIGQRLSLKDQLCTVRYFGPVAEKSGEWLGVEWDNPARGKNDGSHNGTRYFECRNPSSSAASFLKPSQPWDKPRTFLQALREKYMSENDRSPPETLYFSSKQAEQIGFDKFALRQKELHGIHAIVLDGMRIQIDDFQDESAEIAKLCKHITDLDLSNNLIESFEHILSLLELLPKLRNLVLDGNRFQYTHSNTSKTHPGLKTLSLSNTILTWREIATMATTFPRLSSLVAMQNSFNELSSEPLPGQIETIVLSENPFTSLHVLKDLSTCRAMRTLVLRRCTISAVCADSREDSASCLSPNLTSLDLRDNSISSWDFFNHLRIAYPQLKHLQSSGNPLYQNLMSAEGKALNSEDGYMLTLARMPQLDTLNHSKITEKERLNAETYYLNQIGLELYKAPASQHAVILQRHPRWDTLRGEYGEPAVHRGVRTDDVEANILAARLVRVSFTLVPEPGQPQCLWSQEIPKSSSLYAVQGMVAKKLHIMPFRIRLFLETEDDVPTQEEGSDDGLQWWDSDEEEQILTPARNNLRSEKELVPGTRPLGTFAESREAHVRVEILAT